MTGEISLTGDVLPIGGLREKLIAAHRADMKEDYDRIQNWALEAKQSRIIRKWIGENASKTVLN